MADPNWKKIETIIDEALTLPEEKREEFIESHCEGNDELKTEVTLLLESISDSQGWLENPREYKDDFYRDISGDPENVSAGSTLIGEQVGSYRIKELLGEGGMGLVYLAERADGTFEHQVALKVLREGMDTERNIQRFRQERKILAGLNHPNIAGILDGGVMKNGLPYLIMEYVEGIPIDEYCKRKRSTFRERIELFKSVCRAVQHAHNNLIVHRDLKPGNILVNQDGKVKILDFGIAKLLDANDSDETWLRTRTGARILTLSYAAPEQIAGDPVTAGVDNYALGTLLYKLLTGLHPYEKEGKSTSEMEEMILHTTPSKPAGRFKNLSGAKQKQISREMKSTPSNIVHLLQDDIGAIILKNLRKEPEARYSTPSELLEDLARFEKGLPVIAREDTVRYHMAKFIKRHKIGIAVTFIGIVMLLGFGFFYTYQITQERNQAQFEAQKSEQVIQFLTSLFDSNRPSQARGDTLTAIQLLRNGKDQIETMDQQPEVQASLLRVMGDVYRVMGDYTEAEQLLSRAWENQHDLLESDHVEIAKTAEGMAQLKFYTGDFQTSDSLFRIANDFYKQRYETPHEAIARGIANHAELLEETGKLDKAEELYEQALKMFRELYGEEHNQIANVLNNLAIVYEKQGRLDTSAEYYQKSLDMDRSLDTDAHRNPRVITSMHNLAMVYHEKGDLKKALELMEEALDARKELYGNNHTFVASSMNGMAIIQRDLGNYQQSEILYREALEVLRSNYGDDHLHVNINLLNLGNILVYREKYQEADSLFQVALSNFSELLGEEHTIYGITHNHFGESLLKQKKFEESLKHYKQALSIFEKNVSANHPRLGDTMFGLGSNYLNTNEPAKAEPYLNKALEIFKDTRGSGQQKTIDTYFALGKCLAKQAKYAQSENIFLEGIEALVDKKGVENTETQNALQTLLDVYEQWKQPQKTDSLKNRYTILTES